MYSIHDASADSALNEKLLNTQAICRHHPITWFALDPMQVRRDVCDLKACFSLRRGRTVLLVHPGETSPNQESSVQSSLALLSGAPTGCLTEAAAAGASTWPPKLAYVTCVAKKQIQK